MINRGVPRGIKVLTTSTSIRWFGWGLGEAFLPIFLLLFSTNFIETGFLASIYNIFFFLSLPIAAYFADKHQIKKMILISMGIYVFIGMGYFLAGLTGMVVFIIISRGLNGISYSLDETARDSYFIRNSQKNKISRIFGRFDFIGNFWWTIAVLIGFFLVQFFDIEIYKLLFFIAPTSIISFFVVLKLKDEKKKKSQKKFSFKGAYLKIFKEIKNFNKGLKLIAFLALIFGIIDSIIYFFIPISAYLNGNSIVSAALLALISSLPLMFGKHLGKIADKHREKLYIIGTLLLILILISLAFFKNYFFLMAIIFLSTTIFELIYLVNKGMISRIGNKTHIGEIDGSLNGIASIGAIIGPILFGLFTDILNISKSYLIISAIAIFSFFILIKGKKNLKS